MFIVTVRTDGLTLVGDTCLTMGKYETFDEAREVVENDMAILKSQQSRYAVVKGVDRSVLGDRVTIHKHVGGEFDFDVDYVYEIRQEDSENS